MILVLTYHKVLRGAEPKPEFYSVQADRLDAQLETLAGKGFEALAPGDLFNLGIRPTPAYLLSFDDGTLDHFEVVLPILEQHHLRAVFFVPTAKLNCPGYLTSSQAEELSRAGHTLGLHGHEHLRLDRLTEEDVRVQMEISRRILGELSGSKAVMFAPVGGYLDRRVRAGALECGVQVIRTMRWGYNRRCDLTELECIPVNRFFTEAQFDRVLRFRNQSLAYTTKQLAKKVLPRSAYEVLRAASFKLSGRKER